VNKIEIEREKRAKQYLNGKKVLLSDVTICKSNRELFGEFFVWQEKKLKRMNGLRNLDASTFKTLSGYVHKFRIVNTWFKNKAWKQLTKEDIQTVYDDLEDGKILRKDGKPYENLNTTYYSRVFKSKPFELAGKLKLAKQVIEYTKKSNKEVRFIIEKQFKLIEGAASKLDHRLLLWLAWDIGESINALLKLKKCDFYLQKNSNTKEPEYRVNLKREILKRSRTPRSELTNYTETVNLIDKKLSNLGAQDYLFPFEYRNAKQFLDRFVKKTEQKCIPNGEKVTWKDLRSGMACDLLKKKWTTDEVNKRLGHKPNSDEINKYINFLAIDTHAPKAKIRQFELEELHDKLEKFENREKLYSKRNDDLKTEVEEMNKQVKLMKKQNEIIDEQSKVMKKFINLLSKKTNKINLSEKELLSLTE
jgi:hypothetical protein